MFKCQRIADNLIVGDKIDRISDLPDEILGRILSFLKAKEVVATSILSKRWEQIWTTTSNLKELTLQSTEVQPRLKHLRSIFICESLVVLKIKGDFILHLPNCFCLPNLKTLYLDSVVYEDDASAERLFSGCPCLEELDIKRNGCDRVHTLIISIPSLENLCIMFPKVYTDKADRYVTKIDAPNLEYLTLKDEVSEEYLLNPFPSLIEACIYRKCVYGVLQGIENVKYLTLSSNITESLSKIVRENELPKFQYLTELVLGVGEYIDWIFLPKLLDSTPNLEKLSFPEGLVVPDNNGENFRLFYWDSPEKVPECLERTLKSVEIKDFVGVGGERYLVQFFLESSKVLEKMTIYCYDLGRNWKKISQCAMKEIRNCFILSDACKVEFFD